MSYSYARREKKNSKQTDAEPSVSSGKEVSLPNSAQPDLPGHQVDMPVVMREKMEDSFGMDLSGVKLYENKAVGDAGAEAVAQGSKIAFAPGKLDFSSTHGQALLGHEISHVASQARGEVKGSGFLNNSALEARADREGLQAARGESISEGYGGASAALSNASAASASGPMQAKSGKKKIHERARADFESAQLNSSNTDSIKDDLFDIDESEDKNVKVDKMFQLSAAQLRQDQEHHKALNKKIQELIPLYYEQAEENVRKDGFGSVEKEAELLAEDAARKIIKEEDYRYTSDEEEEWLRNMWDNPSWDVMQEVSRRRNMMGEEIYKHRQNLAEQHPDEEKGKLDLQSAYSPAATNYRVYDYMLETSTNDHIANKLFNENKKNTPEQNDILIKAYDIANNSINSSNKYLKKPEGKELQSRLVDEQIKRLGILSHKNKRWKKNE